MKKTILKYTARCGIAAGSLLMLCVLAFYLLVIVGLSPSLQTIWVCSAMKTMSHKYLATAFIPMETIERILAENHVDDTGYDSDILSFESEITEPETADTAIPEPETTVEPETEPVYREETAPGFVPETDPVYEEETASGSAAEPDETTGITETSPAETEAPPAPEEDPYLAEGYERLEDGLYLKPVSGSTWRGYVMLVEDPLRVRLVDTSQQYTCGENVMTMVTNSGAVAGINGGGFQDGANYDSNGGMPAGLLIEDSQLVYPAKADDSTVYNMIGINTDGALVLRHCTSQWALDNGIVSAVSFAPFLVVNGEGLIKNGTGGWALHREPPSVSGKTVNSSSSSSTEGRLTGASAVTWTFCRKSCWRKGRTMPPCWTAEAPRLWYMTAGISTDPASDTNGGSTTALPSCPFSKRNKAASGEGP